MTRLVESITNSTSSNSSSCSTPARETELFWAFDNTHILSLEVSVQKFGSKHRRRVNNRYNDILHSREFKNCVLVHNCPAVARRSITGRFMTTEWRQDYTLGWEAAKKIRDELFDLIEQNITYFLQGIY
ncbi:hypothetical protein INT45_007442 [Circinella minor]|uniref:Uncharacterized protein n=1 Tax=Circinella minor TaxID=1195481 RepID=A0A8H7SDQ4_9FUNG|nr:hypothetical protein INT45_007442 [Circinella minor]